MHCGASVVRVGGERVTWTPPIRLPAPHPVARRGRVHERLRLAWVRSEGARHGQGIIILTRVDACGMV